MKLIAWDAFPNEIEAYTVTKDFGDMSFNNPDTKQILANRLQLAKHLNCNLSDMVAPKQTHTNHFVEVTKQDGGTNIFEIEDKLQDTDALYTKDKEVFLLSFHADCTPIMLYCRKQGIVASIHSGWPGTTKQIVTKVVQHLITKEDCDPVTIYAYIGPSISYSNFEVQEDVIKKIQAMDFDTSPYYQRKDATHYLVDNKGLNKQQLLNLGVPDDNITVSPYCTIDDNALFYSHRKKETGRSITIIKRK